MEYLKMGPLGAYPFKIKINGKNSKLKQIKCLFAKVRNIEVEYI